MTCSPVSTDGIDRPEKVDAIKGFEKAGGCLRRSDPKYTRFSLENIPGPFFLVDKMPADTSRLGLGFSVFTPRDRGAQDVVRAIRGLKRLKIIMAPRMHFTGLTVSKEIDPQFFSTVQNGISGEPLEAEVDILLLLNPNVFEGVLIHEYQHITEVISGRLISIYRTYFSTGREMTDLLGAEFLLAPLGQENTTGVDLMNDAYTAVTELTAEKARYNLSADLRKSYANFDAFMHSNGFYDELAGRVQTLSKSLTSLKASPRNTKDSQYFDKLCGYIKTSVQDSLIEEDSQQIFAACY